MFLSNFSLRQPVAVICLIIAMTALGANSYRKLAVDLLPKLDLPYITIVTVWPGATPTDIEKDVAKRIEDAIGSVNGIKHITSACTDNVCQTFLEFHLGTDVNVAANDVREKLDAILADLPRDSERPVVLKFDVNARPIITLALTGEATVEEMYDYADNHLRDRLSTIPGVANVELAGGAKREVQVLLDRDALAAANLTSLDVVEAAQKGILSMPAGRVKQSGREYGVRFDADYGTISSIGSLEIANHDGVRRYIKDLGRVEMTAKEQRQAAFVDGLPCISIRLVKKAEANAVQVMENVRSELGNISSSLPGGMRLMWITDDGTFIQSSVESTTVDVLVGVALTAVILFAFLLKLQTTLVAAITMPLTVLSSLWFVQLCGFSLNFATLLAIGLSVGMLVTDTIVVLESITKHFASAPSTWEAARIGTSDVAVRGIASTMTHIVVLLPIGLMASRAGQFFRPFAVTTLIVNVVSFFISFTLTPVLCALLLGRTKTAGGASGKRSLAEKWEGVIAGFAHRYAQALHWVAQRRWLSVGFLLAVVAMLVHAALLTPSIGLDFIPNCDKGEILIVLEYPTSYDLSNALSRTRQAEAALRDMPSLRHILMTIGKVEGGIGLSSEGVQLAQLFLKFDPKTERTRTVEQMLPEIRKRLAGHTDCIVTASIPFILGGQQLPIDLEIAGEDLDVLNDLAARVQKLAGAVPGIIDPDTTVRDNKPEILIRPRRTLLADANAPVRALAVSMRANIEGVKAASFKQGARTYDIRVKLAERQGVSQVEQFELPGGRGAPVVLAGLADIQRSSVPVMITRVDKRRVVKLYANTTPGYPLGTAVEALSKAIDRQGHFPAGYTYRFGGNYELMSESNAGFVEAGIMAIGLTYLVLSSILASFSRPLLILVTIPLGFIGVVWALYPTHVSMSIFVLLGMVLLIGIVVTTAVLVLDRVRVHESGGRSRVEAMLQAVEDEFRPVALVTLAAVLGMLPLAISGGLGSELRVGIGIASMGGIIISAWLTLSVLPLAFLLVRERSAAPAPPPGSST